MAKIIRAPKPGSSAGKTQRDRVRVRAGDKATKRTHSLPSVSGWSIRTPEPLRFGIVKRLGNPNLALLDFDHVRVPRLDRVWKVCRIIGVRPATVLVERTARGWHLTIALSVPLTRGELVAFQALCESDWKREALNLMRVISIRRLPVADPFWRQRWNLLYVEKLERHR